jgi:hypothetical protein
MTQHSPLFSAVAVDAPSTANADSSAGINLRGELRDGTPVCIRAIRPDDKERLRVAFERLSPGTVYRRFFHPRKPLTSEDLRMLTELDFRDHVSLAVTVDEGLNRIVLSIAGSPAEIDSELRIAVPEETNEVDQRAHRRKADQIAMVR